jgi:hypothetical protein
VLYARWAGWFVPDCCLASAPGTPQLLSRSFSFCARSGGTLNVARAVRLLLNDQAGAPPPSPPAPTGTGEHAGLAAHCAQLHGLISGGRSTP